MVRSSEIWKKLVLAGILIIVIHSTTNVLLNMIPNNDMKYKPKNSVIFKSSKTNSDGTVDVILNIDFGSLKEKVKKDIEAKPTAAKVQYTPNPPPIIPQVFKGNDICEKYKPKLIIYVHSAPGNIIRRSHVRRTWANINLFKDKYSRVVFVLGRPSLDSVQENIDAESKEFGDIIQGDFKDHYKNLTLKAIFALKWVEDSCKSAKYTLKSDDDAFMNIFQIRKLIEERKPNEDEKVLICALYHAHQMPILRNPKNCMKWCVKDHEFPGETSFPQYCAGLGFLLKTNTIPYLLENVPKTPFFWIDDVYTTGLLVKNIPNLQIVDVSKIFMLKAKEAIKLYRNKEKELKIPIFVHATSSQNFRTLFKLAYLRLSDEDKKLVNFDFQKLNVTIN